MLDSLKLESATLRDSFFNLKEPDTVPTRTANAFTSGIGSQP